MPCCSGSLWLSIFPNKTLDAIDIPRLYLQVPSQWWRLIFSWFGPSYQCWLWPWHQWCLSYQLLWWWDPTSYPGCCMSKCVWSKGQGLCSKFSGGTVEPRFHMWLRIDVDTAFWYCMLYIVYYYFHNICIIYIMTLWCTSNARVQFRDMWPSSLFLRLMTFHCPLGVWLHEVSFGLGLLIATDLPEWYHHSRRRGRWRFLWLDETW